MSVLLKGLCQSVMEESSVPFPSFCYFLNLIITHWPFDTGPSSSQQALCHDGFTSVPPGVSQSWPGSQSGTASAAGLALPGSSVCN